jgi:hypothetical protein
MKINKHENVYNVKIWKNVIKEKTVLKYKIIDFFCLSENWKEIKIISEKKFFKERKNSSRLWYALTLGVLTYLEE